MSLIGLLGSRNYIIVNKTIVKAVGLAEAVILGELCSEYDYWEREEKLVDGGFFYCTVAQMEENTGLSKHEQGKAIKHLEEMGIIRVELKDVPAKRHFAIDENQLAKFFTSSWLKIDQLDSQKLNTNNNKTNNNKKIISKDMIAAEPLSDDPKQSSFLGSVKTQKKESLYSKCSGLINEFTDDAILRNMLTEFLNRCLQNSREGGTPFYTNTFKGKLNVLVQLTKDSYRQREIVKQTLDNGWASFHEIKSGGKSKINHMEGKFKETDTEAMETFIAGLKAKGEVYEF